MRRIILGANSLSISFYLFLSSEFALGSFAFAPYIATDVPPLTHLCHTHQSQYEYNKCIC